MQFNKNIFREYDIRGVYGADLNEALYYHIGKAAGTIYRRKNLSNIVLGMDNRQSSESLSKKLAEGLVSTGCRVTWVGYVPYPLIHFFTTTQQFDGGVYVTASHNTKEYNGVKIEFSKAEPVFGAGIQEIADLIEKEEYMFGEGSIAEVDLTSKYISYLQDSFSFNKKFKIVLNTGNGVTGTLAKKVFEALGVDVVPLNLDQDGNFPSGTPDPEEPEFIEQTTTAVKENSVNAGFGLDGDGDRFLMVDEKAIPYPTDRTLLLLSKHVLQKNPGSKIVYDVKCTSLADDIIKKYGGLPEVMRTGRSYFIKKVVSKEAVLGVEFSGHTYFGDKYFGYDDGIYAICRVLEILDNESAQLSQLMGEFPERVSSPELKIPCADDVKFGVVEKLISEVKNSDKFTNKIFVDGVRANISLTSWFLIRAKNTSPFLGARAEAESPKELEFAIDTVRDLLKPHGLSI